MRTQKYIVFIILLLLLSACNITRHLKEGEYLVRSGASFEAGAWKQDSSGKEVFNPGSKITVDEGVLSSSVRLRPNRKVLFTRPWLSAYNLGKSYSLYEYPLERFVNFFAPSAGVIDTVSNFLMNTFGEPPVLLNDEQLRLDAENMRSVYVSRGYFDARIQFRVDTLKYRQQRFLKRLKRFKGTPSRAQLDSLRYKKKANVVFEVEEGPASIIDRITYQAAKNSVTLTLEGSKDKSLLQEGDNYNEQNLTGERGRVTWQLRERGYFNFRPDMISYDIKTKMDSARIKGTPPNNPQLDPNHCRPIEVIYKIPEKPPSYYIREIRFLLEPAELFLSDIPIRIRSSELDEVERDTLGLPRWILGDSIEKTWLIYERILKKVNLNFLDQLIAFKEKENGKPQRFNITNEEKTQRRLQNLGIFKYVLINYEPVDSTRQVDVIIQAQLDQKYRFKFGVEGFSQNDQTLTSNFPGFGGEAAFRDKLVFKGAEQLDVSVKGNIGFYRPGGDEPDTTYFEIGGKASLSIPRIVLPIFYRKPLGKFNPHTNISLSVNNQRRREYNRITATGNYNFTWFHNSNDEKARSSVSPIVLTFIESRLSEDFQASLDALSPDLQSIIQLDFESRFSTQTRYKYTWSDYNTTRSKPTNFFQPVVALGGNLPFLFDRLVRLPGDSTFTDGVIITNVNDVFYGQFGKLSFEYKRYMPIKNRAELVFRSFTGVAVPYNYTRRVPFDARFFSGGTNSMRAWQSNSLGPGTFRAGTDANVSNIEFLVSPGGEFIFEANLELRWNPFSFFEFAFFSDVGNVWLLPQDDDGIIDDASELDGGFLDRETFTQLGWDAGFGLRLDFGFFIFRLDLAQQIYAPDKQDFVVKSNLSGLGGGRYQVNFGIGYPF